VPEMRKCQKEKANEAGSGGTRSYFERCVAIVQPVRGRVVVAAIFVVTILAVDMKYTIEGSSWIYSIINAAMIAAGIGLAVLSTAMIANNETRE
jgi:hypothetical protein